MLFDTFDDLLTSFYWLQTELAMAPMEHYRTRIHLVPGRQRCCTSGAPGGSRRGNWRCLSNLVVLVCRGWRPTQKVSIWVSIELLNICSCLVLFDKQKLWRPNQQHLKRRDLHQEFIADTLGDEGDAYIAEDDGYGIDEVGPRQGEGPQNHSSSSHMNMQMHALRYITQTANSHSLSSWVVNRQFKRIATRSIRWALLAASIAYRSAHPDPGRTATFVCQSHQQHHQQHYWWHPCLSVSWCLMSFYINLISVVDMQLKGGRTGSWDWGRKKTQGSAYMHHEYIQNGILPASRVNVSSCELQQKRTAWTLTHTT